VKNKPILLQDGAICAPASLEFKRRPIGGRKWQAFADFSPDGLSWQAQKPIPARVNLIQPSFWESGTGLHALLRSDAGAIFRSDSRDGGVTWSKARATKLPNNNSGIDTAYDGGRLYIVYNPVGKNWGPRTPLAVSASQDNGAAWREMLILEDAKGEYSYPSMIAAAGALHVVYTHQRRGIVYAKVLL
jgi:predicted neuraminidase